MSKPFSRRDLSAVKNPATALGFFARVRARRGRLSFGTPLDWLLSLLLVVQLVGASAFALPQDQTVQAPGLSSLSAALGEPVPICLHGDPGSPTPSMPSDCGHCTLCHLMAGGIALLDVSGVAAPSAVVATAEHLALSPLVAAPRRAGSASPRGPPSLV